MQPPIDAPLPNGNAALAAALGQFLVTVAFTAVTVALLVQGRAVPPELWTLNVAIVSFYLGGRLPTTLPRG